jgi:predicted O-linked N-acetylglucosamine transferase (SPINDLY family)
VTFGSFNQFSKMTDSMLTAWKKIMDAVPNSRLILKNKTLETDDGRDFVGNRLKCFGIDAARVEMYGFTADYFMKYNDVDIALDTFPYTGGVTTCEALYMGVPVISLYGARHGTRFGLSILKNIGLEELAVNSYDEYINRAVALANDWELLTILRKNLRGMMEKSPLMDSTNYIREVEKAFIKIMNDVR